MAIGLGEFLERKAWNLRHHIVDARLKGSRCRALGDFIAQFVQGVAHRQFGGNLGNRETGRLGGQGGRTGHAGIHFNDDQPPVLRVDGELHVRPARVHANLAQHGNRGITHDLIFLVSERLRWGHRD